MAEPRRCPACNALVVDRRSPLCTTCHEPLPADWVMTPDQLVRTVAIDEDSRARHAESMAALDDTVEENPPAIVPEGEADAAGPL